VFRSPTYLKVIWDYFGISIDKQVILGIDPGSVRRETT
jgi:hypothetical protein